MLLSFCEKNSLNNHPHMEKMLLNNNLKNHRAAPAVIFLSRSIRASWWSSRPSWAHCGLQWSQLLWSPCRQTDWEDWEPSVRSAPLRRGRPMLCPVPQRLQKLVSWHARLFITIKYVIYVTPEVFFVSNIQNYVLIPSININDLWNYGN